MANPRNPYTPGDGVPPPFFAGRTEELEALSVQAERLKLGRFREHLLFVGLRGVGKTALLREGRLRAKASGALTADVAVISGRCLMADLIGSLRPGVVRLGRNPAASELVGRALGGFASFARAHPRLAGGMPTSDPEAIAGLCDTGDLEHDAAELLSAAAQCAAATGAATVLYVDGLHRASAEDLRALVRSIARAREEGAMVGLAATGLPQAEAMARAAATDLGGWRTRPIGELGVEEAVTAVREPGRQLGVRYTDQALGEILRDSGRHPYFLQQWCSCAWDLNPTEILDRSYLDRVRAEVQAELDARFFAPVLEQASSKERRYARAMAEFGDAVTDSAAVAALLGKPMSAVAPERSGLIAKGAAYSPARGQATFTTPRFAGYLTRIMPGL